MIEVVLFALACAATAVALHPLLRKGEGPGVAADESAEDLFLAKERVYSNIKDLDFDYQMGKIGDEDHQAMRGMLKGEAGAIIDRIEQLQGGDKRMALEREIARHRKRGSVSSVECPECGAAIKSADRFCSGCGHKLD